VIDAYTVEATSEAISQQGHCPLPAHRVKEGPASRGL